MLLVLAFAVTLAVGGCVRYPRLAAAPRPLVAQASYAVLVEFMCINVDPFLGDEDRPPPSPDEFVFGGRGSGVIIDARHVLTAYHVAGGCPYLYDAHVILPSGKRLRMVVEKEWRDSDVVRLEIRSADSFGPIAPPPVREARVGDVVCSQVAFPSRGGHCGSVIERTPSVCFTGRHACVDMRMQLPADSGNSGGGIYLDGALIGLVTATEIGDDGKPDGIAAGHSLPKDVMP